MRREETVLWLLLCVGILIAAVPMPGLASEPEACPECCFEDVTVRGAGALWVNQTYEFVWLHDGCPTFRVIRYLDGNRMVLGYLEYYAGHGWRLWAFLESSGGTYLCHARYSNYRCTSTPPATGWVLAYIDPPFLCDCGDGLPPPRLSGGNPCGGATELVPAGLAGFLDRGWTEDEQPPTVGELPVSAAYSAGEFITGCCAVVDSMGYPLVASYIEMTWYATTIGDGFFDVREPIDSRLLYEESGTFWFGIDTAGWTPGYYDIRLGVPSEDEQWIRVEVMAPTE